MGLDLQQRSGSRVDERQLGGVDVLHAKLSGTGGIADADDLRVSGVGVVALRTQELENAGSGQPHQEVRRDVCRVEREQVLSQLVRRYAEVVGELTQRQSVG